MEYKYDRESVQELLAWAKSALESKTYPPGPVQMNVSTKVVDCGFYLKAMISTISANWEKPTYRSAINQLCDFKGKLEEINA